MQKATLPLVPGGEVAGTLEETGERVVALVGSGGYAEYAAAPRSGSSRSPRASTTDGSGADDPGDDRLASAAHGARLQEGESVVVHSAAGGVGSLATQLAGPSAPDG